jgi:hypothetical protein
MDSKVLFGNCKVGDRVSHMNVKRGNAVLKNGKAVYYENGYATQIVHPPKNDSKAKTQYSVHWYVAGSPAGLEVINHSLDALEEYVKELIYYINGPGMDHYKFFEIADGQEKELKAKEIYNSEDYDEDRHASYFEHEWDSCSDSDRSLGDSDEVYESDE